MLNFQTLVHYSFHFIVPGLLAWIFFNEQWGLAWMIMIGTIFVDLDHLLARPIFDPKRCSIGFHLLHSYLAIAVYALLLFVPNFYVQTIAVGLLFHMYTDWQDCAWTSYSARHVTSNSK
jgi:Family of unknown function (DUF6122)